MKAIRISDSFFKEHHMLAPGDTVLVAVSGGMDSMCLLDFLKSREEALRIQCAAAHYNHSLRGAESARDQKFVSDYCRGRRIPFCTETGDVKSRAGSKGRGVEETAREMRYEFLHRAAVKTGAAKIATAHTADDNLETVLINLIRGSGIRGLAGIPPVRGMVIRPLLAASRADIETYAEHHGIPFVEDSTNAQDIYTRNKLRHQILPALKEINPGLCARILDMTTLLRADSDYLDMLSEKHFRRLEAIGREFRFPVEALLDLPAPLRSRVIGRTLKELGGNPGYRQLTSVSALLKSTNPSGRLHLGGGAVAFRKYGDIVFSKNAGTSRGFAPVEVKIGGTVTIPELGLRIHCDRVSGKNNGSFKTFLFKSGCICGKIAVRPRMAGDKICLHPGGGTKTLKNLMIDAKIPRSSRGSIPVFADEQGVVAVYGFGVHRRCRAESGDADILKIAMEEL